MDKKELQEELFEVDKLELLDAKKLEFFRDKVGFVSLKYKADSVLLQDYIYQRRIRQ